MNILIADDHTILRQGLRKIIEGQPEFDVVGEAGDGDEALQLLRSLKPDVAVLDINMPGKSGLDIVKECRAAALPTEFIILTMYKEQEYFDEALDSGVKGYILKENASSDLLNCISAVADGKHYVSPILSEYLMNRDARRTKLQEKIPGLSDLTEMERKVLKLIAQNKTSKEIAGELFISHRTVQNHRTNISNKLDLKGYNKLLQFALEHKSDLLTDDAPVPDRRASELPESSTPPGSRPMWVVGVVAVLLVLIAISAWFFFEMQDTDDTEVSMQGTTFDRTRIAVLPFVNIGSEPRDDFLTDGL